MSFHILSRLKVLFETRPLLSQCITGATLFMAGDIIAQVAVERSDSMSIQDKGIDSKRPIAFGLYGFFISVPITASWYRFLEYRVKGKGIMNALGKTISFRRTLVQVFLDQAFFAPIGLVVYFTCTNILLGNSIEDIKYKLSHEYFQALKVNYATWPWIQMLNFHFVPLQFRTVVVNTAALGWNTYMSWLNNYRSRSDIRSKTN
jgi:protein Mpv17